MITRFRIKSQLKYHLQINRQSMQFGELEAKCVWCTDTLSTLGPTSNRTSSMSSPRQYALLFLYMIYGLGLSAALLGADFPICHIILSLVVCFFRFPGSLLLHLFSSCHLPPCFRLFLSPLVFFRLFPFSLPHPSLSFAQISPRVFLLLNLPLYLLYLCDSSSFSLVFCLAPYLSPSLSPNLSRSPSPIQYLSVSSSVSLTICSFVSLYFVKCRFLSPRLSVPRSPDCMLLTDPQHLSACSPRHGLA